MAGSASAGWSGAGASGLADFWAKASPQIGMQAWGMVAPEQMRYGQQQYAQAMGGREQEYMRALQGRQDLLSAYQAPHQLFPAIMGGMAPTFPQGITQQPQNWWERYAMPTIGALGPAAVMAGINTAFSDSRLKIILGRLKKKMSGLSPVSFKYLWGGPIQIGFIAQEVEGLYPEAVTEVYGYKKVDYSMIPM